MANKFLNKMNLYFNLALIILICIVISHLGGKTAAAELQTENPQIQENNEQNCEEGYYRLDDKCVKLNVPENAYVSGNEWHCKPGYKRQDDKCVHLKPKDFAPSLNDTKRTQEYYVSGYGNNEYVYGYVEVYANNEAAGYFYRKEGAKTYFYGKLNGKGLIDAFDNSGHYYELTVE